MHKVSKFGGSSLSCADQIKKVKEIVQHDPARTFVVTSAPGKRWANDTKVTDLLYRWQKAAVRKGKDSEEEEEELYRQIRLRFDSLIAELSVPLDLSRAFADLRKDTKNGAPVDYVASRGEYFTALIVAKFLDYTFVDSDRLIYFHDDSRLNWSGTEGAFRQEDLPQRITRGRDRGFVIPGFYGAKSNGEIVTFPRNGSDISGAIVAACTQAALYENWSDVPGMLAADPRIVKNPRVVPEVTYRELRELAYMGASVFHEEAIFPVSRAEIPIALLNTNDPSAPGTQIVSRARNSRAPGSIVGIAGKLGFTLFTIEKAGMNQEIGFVRRLCSAMEEMGISFEHLPGGIDVISVIIETSQLASARKNELMGRIGEACRPDRMLTENSLALLSIVGEAMAHTPGVAGRVFGALRDAGINVRVIAQGASEISIILGVNEADLKRAIQVIYRAFA